MKFRFLITILIALHVFWIGLATWEDAAGAIKATLPSNIMVSSVILILWVGYQALLWARGALKVEN